MWSRWEWYDVNGRYVVFISGAMPLNSIHNYVVECKRFTSIFQVLCLYFFADYYFFYSTLLPLPNRVHTLPERIAIFAEPGKYSERNAKFSILASPTPPPPPSPPALINVWAHAICTNALRLPVKPHIRNVLVMGGRWRYLTALRCEHVRTDCATKIKCMLENVNEYMGHLDSVVVNGTLLGRRAANVWWQPTKCDKISLTL